MAITSPANPISSISDPKIIFGVRRDLSSGRVLLTIICEREDVALNSSDFSNAIAGVNDVDALRPSGNRPNDADIVVAGLMPDVSPKDAALAISAAIAKQAGWLYHEDNVGDL